MGTVTCLSEHLLHRLTSFNNVKATNQIPNSFKIIAFSLALHIIFYPLSWCLLSTPQHWTLHALNIPLPIFQCYIFTFSLWRTSLWENQIKVTFEQCRACLLKMYSSSLFPLLVYYFTVDFFAHFLLCCPCSGWPLLRPPTWHLGWPCP